jgi:hypothetical protein
MPAFAPSDLQHSPNEAVS